MSGRAQLFQFAGDGLQFLVQLLTDTGQWVCYHFADWVHVLQLQVDMNMVNNRPSTVLSITVSKQNAME